MVNVWLIFVDHRFMLYKNGDGWWIVYDCFTNSMSDWWFGTMDFYDFPYIGNSNSN